jgi:hypothetical protein
MYFSIKPPPHEPPASCLQALKYVSPPLAEEMDRDVTSFITHAMDYSAVMDGAWVAWHMHTCMTACWALKEPWR